MRGSRKEKAKNKVRKAGNENYEKRLERGKETRIVNVRREEGQEEETETSYKGRSMHRRKCAYS